jgi:hypothetical protein
MTPPHCSLHREQILRHFLDGTALDPQTRAHYAECVHCMTAVTEVLSGNANGTPPGRSAVQTRAGSAGQPPAPAEPASRALEHGRQVLEREFGIRPGAGPTQSA